MTYEETVNNLFTMLKQVIALENEQNKWKNSIDKNRMADFFGNIHDAIQAIAGTEIIRHWCETKEVDCTLAKKN